MSGADVFELHDTYGFPAELTREIARESGVDVDMAGYRAAMREQRERARADARANARSARRYERRRDGCERHRFRRLRQP